MKVINRLANIFGSEWYLLAIGAMFLFFTSCSSTLATTYDDNGTKVITKTVYVPTFYNTNYHSFYGVAGLGYHSNFYRPVYRPYRARPFVRNHRAAIRGNTTRVKPTPRRVVRPTRSIRPTRSVRSGTTGNTIKRTNIGRRQ